MSGKLLQGQDGSRTPLEDCKDLASMLNIVFMILERRMTEPSEQGKVKKERDTGE